MTVPARRRRAPLRRRGLRRFLLSLQRKNVSLPAPVRRLSRAVLVRLTSVDERVVDPWDLTLTGAGAMPQLEALGRHVEEPVRVDTAHHDEPVLRVVVAGGPLDAGGTDEVIAGLARGLARGGAFVDLVVFREDGEEVAEGRLARELRTEGLVPQFIERRQAADFLLAAQPDVVSSHSAPAWLAPLVGRLGIPHVETIHGLNPLYSTDWGKEQVRTSYLDAVVVVSEVVRRQYLLRNPALDPRRVHVIPNALLGRPQRTFDRDAVRSALGLGEQFLFVSLGRFSIEKNAFGLVDAFVTAAPEMPDAILLVAGNVDDAQYASHVRAHAERSAVARRVHLRDHTDLPDALLAAADCYVSDSFCEGWPLVTMEALAQGIPVISSHVGGMLEQLGPSGANGVIVDNPAGHVDEVDWDVMRRLRFEGQTNREDLVTALKDVWAAREVWRERSSDVAAEAIRRFDRENWLSAHLDVLRECARQGSTAAPSV